MHTAHESTDARPRSQRNWVLMGAVAVTIVMFATACSQDDSVDSNETTQTDGVGVTIPTSDPDTEPQPEAAPQEVRDNPKDWALPGRDYANSRSTFDSLISSENVDRLEEVWRAEVGGALSTVPLIVDDTVYVQDSTGTIYAFDAETGDTRWQSEPSGFNIGPFGVAVADGRVFGLHGSNGIVAVDIDSGEELWVTKITSTPTEGVDIQPLAYDGVVLASTVPISIDDIYRGGDRGILHALDAETGDVLWTFDTVKSEDLWGNPEVNSGGGSWYPPSIDPDRGLVYWGVANPAPFPGTPEFPNGSSRPGPNLYTNSAVALDLSTGGLRWYQQVISHDLFDRDLVHTMLVTLGDGSDVVVATGKGGTVVGIDPDGGDLLWETAIGTHENDELDELDGPTRVMPGTFGGVLTPPAWAEGIVYAATLNAPTELNPDAPAYFGAELGTGDGEIVAIEAETGAVLWATSVPGDPLGGVTVVNDLVFTALLDGTIIALDRRTGSILSEIVAPGGINGWMSVVGDLVVIPAGNASPPALVGYRLNE